MEPGDKVQWFAPIIGAKKPTTTIVTATVVKVVGERIIVDRNGSKDVVPLRSVNMMSGVDCLDHPLSVGDWVDVRKGNKHPFEAKITRFRWDGDVEVLGAEKPKRAVMIRTCRVGEITLLRHQPLEREE